MLISFIISAHVFQTLGKPVTLINRHTNGERIADELDKTQLILKPAVELE